MTQHLCHIHWGFTIPGSVFTPPPQVDAVVLKLTPLVQPLIQVDYKSLELMVKVLFQFRRKYIRRGASLLFPSHPELVRHLFLLVECQTLSELNSSPWSRLDNSALPTTNWLLGQSFVIHRSTMRHLLDHLALIMHSILYVCIMTSSDHKC
jgi:16S rRNA A1518/A1519 N6-dimethyltransferase RsmA/KsgA/DIM1 with predicted DNA glycosylase/AP lyase activity